MVHPDRDALKLFVGKRLGDAKQMQAIELHLSVCDFCRGYCVQLRAEIASMSDAESFQLNSLDRQLADRLFHEAMSGRVIPLNIMPMPSPLLQACLSADGAKPEFPGVVNIATLYSEDPELVLRVMRDSEQTNDYLQLIGSDPQLTAHVMIRIPEINREYITDTAGKASVRRGELDHAQSLKWEIKMPNAGFELRPIVFDPEQVESSREVILETEQHDRIQVTFAAKTSGKQILIKVLELDGISDFGSVRVSISQQTSHEIRDIAPQQVVPFAIVDPDQEISIRLYR